MKSKKSVWKKVKEDKVFRRKFIGTGGIIFSYTTLGFFFSNLGPALPDIQLLIRQDLAVTSWLFTATSTGCLIGTLVCGPLCDRIGPQVVLFVSVFAGSCLTGIFIYCPSFTAMLVVRVLTGIFIGGVDIGGIASVTDIWKSEARPYMFALQLMLSLGGIVTPVIIRPFLAQRSKVKHIVSATGNDTRTNLSFAGSAQSTVYYLNDSKQINDSYIAKVVTVCSDELERPYFENRTFDKTNCDNASQGANKTLYEDLEIIGETKIQYAFIILAIIGVIASFTVLTFLITDYRNRNKTSKLTVRANSKDMDHTKYIIPAKIKAILLAIVSFQCYLIAAMSSKVYALLPSYFVLQFSWTTSSASVAMSVFWVGKAFARLVGVFLSMRFKQSVLIPCFCSTYIISAACLSVAGWFQITDLAWVSTATLGIGLSILFPTLFTLTEENISHVSGRIASLYLVFFVVGGMVDPLYTGYLMDKASPMWFTYLIFFQGVIFISMFVLVKLLLCNCGQRKVDVIEIETEIEPINDVTKV